MLFSLLLKLLKIALSVSLYVDNSAKGGLDLEVLVKYDLEQLKLDSQLDLKGNYYASG